MDNAQAGRYNRHSPRRWRILFFFGCVSAFALLGQTPAFLLHTRSPRRWRILFFFGCVSAFALLGKRLLFCSTPAAQNFYKLRNATAISIPFVLK